MDDDNSVYSARNFLRTVKEIKTGESSTKYSFENPIIHTHGKGFLGFGKMIFKNYVDEELISSNTQVSSLVSKGLVSKYELLPDTLIQTVGSTDVSSTTMRFTTKSIGSHHYLVPNSTVNSAY
jgi:hypothetical protein